MTKDLREALPLIGGAFAFIAWLVFYLVVVDKWLARAIGGLLGVTITQRNGGPPSLGEWRVAGRGEGWSFMLSVVHMIFVGVAIILPIAIGLWLKFRNKGAA